ncbi:hypothetical protein UFOVP49_189 [uncultured Caudovirales phage]|uniref:Uncharacterized protein n=1 Tax=uncultured Caudovirales phage TaxID=2100421 RepID=A0A6J5KR48_9CAUD|nr:hypothetical protein UFOVP49_189 [uncultured Caudovirales phage]
MANPTDDFGFTFHDEIDLDEQINSAVTTTETTYAEKLKAVEAIVVPFMQNLMKDPDKVMIRWPNRKDIVEKQLKRILAITQN